MLLQILVIVLSKTECKNFFCWIHTLIQSGFFPQIMWNCLPREIIRVPGNNSVTRVLNIQGYQTSTSKSSHSLLFLFVCLFFLFFIAPTPAPSPIRHFLPLWLHESFLPYNWATQQVTPMNTSNECARSVNFQFGCINNGRLTLNKTVKSVKVLKL